ncbi:glucose-6-phosphate dehydrogenase, partial [Streptomyces sp. DSM 41529]|nr:glucose-6-phosphate dehydrogenase [Streptomyces sp. DSM 41529]
LKKHGLADQSEGSWRRAVIEKPFGHDLASAQELNQLVHDVFPPNEVFRIDHYLGKETVQNILALRFANTMWEPIWNRSYVDHVQITMAEDIGIGGRAGYYDGIGAARDVIQNHLLQLLALTAMEEPGSFHPKALVAEKLKVLTAVELPEDLGLHTVRA